MAAAVTVVTVASTLAPSGLAAQEKQPSHATQAAREYKFEIRPPSAWSFPRPPTTSTPAGTSAPASRHAAQLAHRTAARPHGHRPGLEPLPGHHRGGLRIRQNTRAFRPYLIGGLGIYDGDFGLNAGIGVDFAIVDAPFGFFVEGRYHRVFEDPDDVGFIPLNAGIRLRF
jgi:hypothetical protein